MAGTKVELKTENDKFNYSVGYRLGGDFKRQEVEVTLSGTFFSSG